MERQGPEKDIVYGIPAEWACDVPLWDTSGGWEEDVCGSQGLETLEAGESCVVICMLRDG